MKQMREYFFHFCCSEFKGFWFVVVLVLLFFIWGGFLVGWGFGLFFGVRGFLSVNLYGTQCVFMPIGVGRLQSRARTYKWHLERNLSSECLS